MTVLNIGRPSLTSLTGNIAVGTDVSANQYSAMVPLDENGAIAVPATGVAQDTGGAGITGWLSSAVSNLRLAVTSLSAINTSTASLAVALGSKGTDNSANKPAIPLLGAVFSTGTYASYTNLLCTVPVNTTRANIEIVNTSGAQIVVVRDDGTATNGQALNNASVFAIGSGGAVGSQGGGWNSTTFKGRLQVFGLSSTAQVAVFQD